MHIDYTVCSDFWPRLQASVVYMATGKGTMKERLSNVIKSYLIALQLQPGRSEIDTLLGDAIALATKEKDPTGKLGHVNITLATSSWQKDQKIARKIFEAYELAAKQIHWVEGP